MLRQTPRSTPHVKSDRVVFDEASAHAILDEAPSCNIGFVVDGAPVVIPTFPPGLRTLDTSRSAASLSNTQ